MVKKLIIYVVLWLVSLSGFAQTHYPVSYTLDNSLSVKAESVFSVVAKFNVDKPWYIYAPTGNNAAQGMLETTIIYQLPPGFVKKGKMQLPESHFKGGFEVYEGDSIIMSQDFQVDKDLPAGEYTIHAKISYQSCNEKICLPPKTDETDVKVVVGEAGDGAPVSGEHKLRELAAEKESGDSHELDLQFKALDGRKIDLAYLKGKLVLIDCWATWCRPCIAEFDNLKKLYDKYHKHGFEVIGVSADVASAKPRVLKLVKEHGLPWPQRFEGVGFDKDAFLQANGVQSLPTVFLIDKDGKIVDRDARGERLEGLIKKYLE